MQGQSLQGLIFWFGTLFLGVKRGSLRYGFAPSLGQTDLLRADDDG
jgi:hypothetical protein